MVCNNNSLVPIITSLEGEGEGVGTRLVITIIIVSSL